MDDKFYIQDCRNYVGNSMLWWKHGNCGYVCDIREAKVFTKAGAERICKRAAHFKMWLKEFIDARIEHHISRENMRVIENGKVIKGFKS